MFHNIKNKKIFLIIFILNLNYILCQVGSIAAFAELIGSLIQGGVDIYQNIGHSACNTKNQYRKDREDCYNNNYEYCTTNDNYFSKNTDLLLLAACVLTIFHNQDREIAIFREKMDNHCHNAQYCYVSSSPGLSMFYGCIKK